MAGRTGVVFTSLRPSDSTDIIESPSPNAAESTLLETPPESVMLCDNSVALGATAFFFLLTRFLRGRIGVSGSSFASFSSMLFSSSRCWAV